MKKRVARLSLASRDNSFGVAAVVLGILSILFASINGIILGILALIFAVKQQNSSPNKWGKVGKILAIVGIVLSVAIMIATAYFLSDFISQYPGLM